MERRTFTFESNVDELVDTHERYWKRSKAGQSERRRAILRTFVAFTLALFVTAFLSSGANWREVVPIAVLALVLGGAFWPLYGRLHDAALHRRLRLVIDEEVAGDRTWICEMALRKEGVWSRSRGIEILFPWRELRSIDDTADAVEFLFNGGLVMVRSRAFADAEEQAKFVETAHQLKAAAG